jgi:hypothetical protein
VQLLSTFWGALFRESKCLDSPVRLFVAYSGGIDISVGEFRDTIKAWVDIETGGYCRRYMVLWRSWRIGCRTSWSRRRYLFAETISYGANRTVGQIVIASPDFHSSEDELSVGSGNALRSIEWDDGNLKIEASARCLAQVWMTRQVISMLIWSQAWQVWLVKHTSLSLL